MEMMTVAAKIAAKAANRFDLLRAASCEAAEIEDFDYKYSDIRRDYGRHFIFSDDSIICETYRTEPVYDKTEKTFQITYANRFHTGTRAPKIFVCFKESTVE